MAKDGDIIDVMFGWIISLFGWILGGVIKAGMWLISKVFSFLISGIKLLWNIAFKKEV